MKRLAATPIPRQMPTDTHAILTARLVMSIPLFAAPGGLELTMRMTARHGPRALLRGR
jgi:hypothetical protein